MGTEEKMARLETEALGLNELVEECKTRLIAISQERVNIRAACLHHNSSKDAFSRRVCVDCGTVTDLAAYSW